MNEIKIALNNTDISHFFFKKKEIGGDLCVLCYPKSIKAKWNKENLILRSCLYRKSDYFPISFGHFKFFNSSEKPDLYPKPEDFRDWIVEDKLDGSLLSVSNHEGELIVRTRGCLEPEKLESGFEIEILKQKYPKAFDNFYIKNQYSLLFEWLSETNVIVLKYHDCPDIVLTGAIKHDSYTYCDNTELNEISEEIGVKRPKQYKFSSLSEISKACQELKEIEGFVLSYNNYQNRVKLKTNDYLVKHRFKFDVSLERVLDIFLELSQPEQDEFQQKMVETYDYECMMMVQEFINKVCGAKKEIDKMLSDMVSFVEPLKKLERKEAAAEISKKYKEMAAFAFLLLDNREFNEKQWKSLYLRKLSE